MLFVIYILHFNYIAVSVFAGFWHLVWCLVFGLLFTFVCVLFVIRLLGISPIKVHMWGGGLSGYTPSYAVRSKFRRSIPLEIIINLPCLASGIRCLVFWHLVSGVWHLPSSIPCSMPVTSHQSPVLPVQFCRSGCQCHLPVPVVNSLVIGLAFGIWHLVLKVWQCRYGV